MGEYLLLFLLHPLFFNHIHSLSFRYTACHVHKSVNEEFIINQHLNDREDLFPNHPYWKNYTHFRQTGEKLNFNKSGKLFYINMYILFILNLLSFNYLVTSIHSYDVRSQYPSAALPPNPVGNAKKYNIKIYVYTNILFLQVLRSSFKFLINKISQNSNYPLQTLVVIVFIPAPFTIQRNSKHVRFLFLTTNYISENIMPSDFSYGKKLI